MGIVVKYREAFPSSNLDEYVDAIDPGNLRELKDGRIESQSLGKGENGKPFIFRADLKIDHGNPATIRLTYSKKDNKELADKGEIVLGTFTFKIEDGEYHGTGKWIIEGKREEWEVKWADPDPHQYYRSLARPEQPAFRAAVMKAYGSTCAISGCRTEEALEAAHVVPVSQGGGYAPENGILLRRDLHRLFDLDLVAINPEGLVVAVSERISADYKKYDGRKTKLPPKGGPKACHFNSRWERWERLQRTRATSVR